jgi:uncharacterized membrane protein
MTPHALLFTIAAIGISETSYLIRKRKANERPICVFGEKCHEVLESKYNSLFFGIPNDILGLLFYSILAILTAFIVIGRGEIEIFVLLTKLIILGSVGMSLVFLYIQWKILKAWCFWCIVSAFTTFLMGLIVVMSNLAIF